MKAKSPRHPPFDASTLRRFDCGSGPTGPPATLLMALALLLGPAATCENQDYYRPDSLVLESAAPFQPDLAEIEQPYRGLNSIDYALTNTGAEPSRYGLLAAAYCPAEGTCVETADCAANLICDGETCTACPEKVFTDVVGPIDPGATVKGRLFESDLGLGDVVHLEFHCFAETAEDGSLCSGRLDYTVLLRQVECRSNNDCPAQEMCETAQGLCRVQGEGQGCNVTNRRDPGRWFWLSLLALVMLAVSRSVPSPRSSP